MKTQLQTPTASVATIPDTADLIDIKKVSLSLSPEVQAAVLFIKRKERLDHPEGGTDRGGRWYPKGRDAEVFPADAYRSPSRAWRWSYMVACRTAAQCARYHDVDVKAVRSIARGIEAEWDGKEPVEAAVGRIFGTQQIVKQTI